MGRHALLCENTCGGFYFIVMSKKITQEEFIEKARLIHGNKYDYSKIVYINARTKVCIICPIHGEFWQTPHSHLNNHGCPVCGKNVNNSAKRKTNEKFLQEIKNIFGNNYDYSKVDYINSTSPIILICKKHKTEIKITPKNLLKMKTPCPLCRDEKKVTTEKFIKKAKNIHNNKYDYSKVKYVNNSTKVCIICPEHGEFWQTPQNHICLKHGCPTCGIILNGKIHNKTTEYFVKKAEEIHGKRYVYLKTVYAKRSDAVTITCPIHGDFIQRAGNHLNGCGCPKCSISRLEENMMKTLDKYNIKYEYEKSFEWLKKDGKMTIDFYIPEYNAAIECQGEQHYKPVEYFGGVDEFKKDCERDKTKKILLEKHKIDLLYYADIKYDDNVFTDPEKIIEVFKNIK